VPVPCVELERRCEYLRHGQQLPSRFGLWPRQLLFAERSQSLFLHEHGSMRRLGGWMLRGFGGDNGASPRSRLDVHPLLLRGRLRPRLLLPHLFRHMRR
jgi:hypothetical protein